MKKCSKCGKENLDEAIFCADCGAKLISIGTDSNKCPKCGKVNYYSAIKCARCGASLNSISDGADLSGSASSSTSNQFNSISDGADLSGSASSSTSNQENDESPDKWKICCCYVPLILFIFLLIWAMIYQSCAESFDTVFPDNFNDLDLNSDGKISFDEISQFSWTVEYWKLKSFFNQADTNNNGYLKGHEFDLFADAVLDDQDDGSDDSGSDKSQDKQSSSSSSKGGRDYSSGTNKYTHELNNMEFDSNPEGYVLTCPYCGSEALYETGGYYKCAECGSSIYDPDDLELGYIDGYMELLLPIFSYSS